MPSAGRVGRPHGLDGSFHVTQPEPRLLEVGAPVVVGDTATRIASRKGTEAAPVIRLEITSDRSAAVALRGSDLVVERADAPSLEDDEYWAEDLIGCRVVSSSGSLGVVRALLALPSCEALDVEGLTDPVPLVRDAIRRVDLEKREIEVDPEFLNLAT